MDQDQPDYDMDSEDESWLEKQAEKMELSPLTFENMMDRLEKGSGQTVGVTSRLNACHARGALGCDLERGQGAAERRR